MSKVFSIAKYSFLDNVRTGLLLASAILSLTLLVGVALFGSVSIGSQLMVVKDFSFFVMSFIPILLAILTGASIVQKEIAKKTIYNILSKPISRGEVLVGKFFGLFGLSLVLFLEGLIISVAFYALLGGAIGEILTPSLILILCELLIVSALVVFFSSLVVTPLLVGLFAFGIFLAGRSSPYLHSFAENAQGGAAKAILTTLYWIIPDLSLLSPKSSSLINFDQGLWAVLYSIGYVLLTLMVAKIFFTRRDFP